MKMIYVEQLPIPAVPPGKQAPIVALVEQILAAKNVGANRVRPPFADNGNNGDDCDKGACHAPLQESHPTDIPDLEAEIDRLVYALYGLTEDEIAVVEGKTP